jgi:hypothetical protein
MGKFLGKIIVISPELLHLQNQLFELKSFLQAAFLSGLFILVKPT